MNTLFLLFYHGLFTLTYPILFLTQIPALFASAPTRRRALGKLGWVSPRGAKTWIHAVSGGEAALCRPLMEMLGDGPYLITTQSATGMETLTRLYGNNPAVHVLWFPFDFWPLMARFLSRSQVTRFIVIEHDLWPGLLALCRRKKIATALVNAAFKPRDLVWLRRFPFLIPLLYGVDRVAAQNPHEAELAKNLRGWNIPIATVGNLKLLPIPPATKLIQSGGRPVVVFGSSHPPEEDFALGALSPFFPRVLFVVVPRHPDRCPGLAKQWAPQYRVCLASSLPQGEPWVVPPETDILLVDRMGVLLRCYAGATIALVGDTFRPSQGGHNFLEPISQGVPVIYGTYMRGFADLTPVFEQMGAALRVPQDALAATTAGLLENPKSAAERGKKGLDELHRRRLDAGAMVKFLQGPD